MEENINEFTVIQNNEINEIKESELENAKEGQKTKAKANKKIANLRVSFLGGIGEVGKNMTVIEYLNDIIVVDAGLMFPTDDMLGIDLVVPDITYLKENKEKIRGFVITHGHEDHIGGLPYVLNEISAPVYGSKLTCALIHKKFEEHKKISFKTNVVKPNQKIKLGVFEIEFIHTNHSIAGAFALAIKTPVGVIMHTGDYHIDLTPVNGEVIDFAKFAEYGNRGVLLLMQDSTNAERPGMSVSEKTVAVTINRLFDEHKDSRIIVATFASNVNRLQEIMNIAEKHNRKVAFTGRSMINMTDIASKVGGMSINKNNIIDIDKLKNYKDNEICIISTGSQGEAMSALVRMANGDFKGIEIGENDRIIFSSSPIPGNEKSVSNLINKLLLRGAKVICNGLEAVHASGHAYRDELKIMFALVKPKYFIPVHGEVKHLMAHQEVAESMGIDRHNIIIPMNGMRVDLNRNYFKVAATVPFGSRLIDGAGIGELDSNVLRERKQLSEDGLCIVMLSVNTKLGILNKPEIVSRGFTYVGEALSWLEEAKSVILDSAQDVDLKGRDYQTLKMNVRKSLTNFLFKKLKRKPMIIPIIVES